MKKSIQECIMVFLPFGRNNAMDTNEMLPDQNTIQEDAEDVGTRKNEKIPKFIFSVFSMF